MTGRREMWTPELREKQRQIACDRAGIKLRYHTCVHCGVQFQHRRRKKDANMYCSRSCAVMAKSSNSNALRDSQSWQVYTWSRAVKDRDGHVCQMCGVTANLHAHHILGWADFPDFRFDLSNGVTLCAECHTQLHRGIGAPITAV